ncbi:MAG: hypothetical protein WDN01_02110 [Rhizomicrobium sp.]
MIFRLLFAILLVWLFVPHEPDLGFGRPGFTKVQFAAKVLQSLYPAVAHDAADRKQTRDIAASRIPRRCR